MAIEVNTKVSIGESNGTGPGNLILEDARFFGRPNFTGELDQFRDDRRKFTVIIPNDVADQLRDMGWNVKTNIPTPDQIEKGFEELSHLKIMLNFKIPEDKRGLPNEMDYEIGPEIFVLQGENHEKLSSRTCPIIDRSRFENIDMEIRAWEYDPEEQPGKYSARLVKFVGVLKPSVLDQKYGFLR